MFADPRSQNALGYLRDAIADAYAPRGHPKMSFLGQGLRSDELESVIPAEAWLMLASYFDNVKPVTEKWPGIIVVVRHNDLDAISTEDDC